MFFGSSTVISNPGQGPAEVLYIDLYRISSEIKVLQSDLNETTRNFRVR